MGFLQGKRALITGIASQRSIASGIAEAMHREGAQLAFTYQNEKLKSRCNKCYAGFTDAYMNEILIEMGFNPIVKRTAVHSVWYNTSGFTYFIKAKFAQDERLVKLTEYVFDRYLK